MDTPCIIGRGCDNGQGYRQRQYKGRVEQSHRIAWMEAHGPIPARKGRMIGAKRSTAKLTPQIAADILRLKSSCRSTRAVAADYAIAHSVVHGIWSGKAWRATVPTTATANGQEGA